MIRVVSAVTEKPGSEHEHVDRLALFIENSTFEKVSGHKYWSYENDGD